MSLRPDAQPARPSPPLAERPAPPAPFRSWKKQSSLHPAERTALLLIGAHLVFLPWALGGMRLWAQLISLSLSVASLAVALVPRTYTEEHTDSSRFRLVMWPRLVAFPVAWLGLAFLGYVAIQGLNPAWVYESDGQEWWTRAVAHTTWLPTGVAAPLAIGGPWRTLLFYMSAWLTVCAVWVAFTRRRTVRLLLLTIATNGLLLAAFGVVQRLLSNGKLFWVIESPNPAFFASFIYKNHGGAYLNLTLAVTCGLAGWYHLRGLRRLQKSNPGVVLAFFALCIAVSVLTSQARGATLVMLVFLAACIGAFVVHPFTSQGAPRKPVIALGLMLIFGCFLKVGFDALDSRAAWDRLKFGLSRQDTSLATRDLATRASADMLRDHAVKGIGAGSFRFLFPAYQATYPALVARNQTRMYWEHAHNDLLQFPIELGLAGVALLGAIGGYWGVRLTRRAFWSNPVSTGILFGALLLLAYAWWDFPFQCPAILITWCALWPAAALWSQCEEQPGRARTPS
ncbi:O-antigen ligase family protein [Horticoccus sp. 23ND18S-11]|uniref:O-antigen ligase family protein n=1 Tax=Horticoccus sp. 23ND18S-11 TaxID=3391832 RepID=UPI0039C8C75B